MLQWILPAPAEGAVLALVSWALTFALHSTLFLGAAWLLDARWARRWGPRTRWRLWCLAVAAPLLTTTVRVGLDTGPGLRWTAEESEKVVARVPADEAGAMAAAPGPELRAGPGPTPARREPGNVLQRPSEGIGAPAHEWPFLAALAWLGGSLAVLAVRARRWTALMRTLRGRRPVEGGCLQAALDAALAGEADPGESRPGVRLSVSGAVTGPVALPGGEICVPRRAVRELPAEELEAMVAHELAHLRRRDPAIRLALAAAECLLWFQPLIAVARRRIVEAAEELADDRVRRQGRGPALAGTLVSVAEWIRDRHRRAPVSRLAASPGIESRVRRLLGEDGGDGGRDSGGPGPGRWLRRGLALCALVGTALGPALYVDAADHGSGTHGSELQPSSVTPLVIRDWADLERAARWVGASVEVMRGRIAGGERLTYLRLDGIDGRLRVTLRPTGGPLRIRTPDGRRLGVEATPWAHGPEPRLVRLGEVGSGNVEILAPADGGRIVVDVGGRLLSFPAHAPGSDLPPVGVPGA